METYDDVNDLLNDLLDYKVVINVRTEDEAKEFVKTMFDKFNMGWEYKDIKYDTYYDSYEEATCYDFENGKNNMYYDSLYYHLSKHKKVIPYSQVRLLLLTYNI